MAHRFRYAVDYFNQYPVERVTSEGDGWTIHFPHGSISCSEGEAPKEVAGRTLVDVDFGGDETTTLRLSGGIVVPIGKDYIVRHPVVGELRPERDEEPDSLPPDPSAERVVEETSENDANA